MKKEEHVVAISKEASQDGEYLADIYQPDTGETYHKMPVSASKIESDCGADLSRYPAAQDRKSVAYTVLGFTHDNAMIAVSNLGETSILTREQVISGKYTVTNISVQGNKLIPQGFLKKKAPISASGKALLAFSNSLIRLQQLVGVETGVYFITGNGDVVFGYPAADTGDYSKGSNGAWVTNYPNGKPVAGNFVILPGTTKIAPYAFASTDVTSIELPDTLKEIGNGAFERLAIKDIHIPSSVTKIGPKAFDMCERLEYIYIDKPENSIEGAPWHKKTGFSRYGCSGKVLWNSGKVKN